MLVAFEGIDACGKQTQVELLRKWGEIHYPMGVVVKSYPNYGSPTGRAIKKLLQEQSPDPMVLQSLMTVNRYEDQREIKKYLDEGFLVILDRYYMSGLVYGLGDGLDIEWLSSVHNMLQEPDHWIILDISVDESFRRRPEREDLYESSKVRLEKARAGYSVSCAMAPHCSLVNGHASAGVIHDRIVDIIGD